MLIDAKWVVHKDEKILSMLNNPMNQQVLKYNAIENSPTIEYNKCLIKGIEDTLSQYESSQKKIALILT